MHLQQRNSSDYCLANVLEIPVYLLHNNQLHGYCIALWSGWSCSLCIRAELNTLGFYQTGAGAYEIYNGIITGHGLGMIFVFIMPTVLSFVGN